MSTKPTKPRASPAAGGPPAATRCSTLLLAVMAVQFALLVLVVSHRYASFAAVVRRRAAGKGALSFAGWLRGGLAGAAGGAGGRAGRRLGGGRAAAGGAAPGAALSPPAPAAAPGGGGAGDAAGAAAPEPPPAPLPRAGFFEPACGLAMDAPAGGAPGAPGAGSPPPLIDFAVVSSFDSRTRRDAIRAGWGATARAAGHTLRFFVGEAGAADEHGALSRASEAKKYGDLVVLNMTDGYEALTAKTLGTFTYAARCGRGRYVGKVDEDVFVYVHRLAKRLARLEVDSAHEGMSSGLGVYLGNFWLEMRAIRQEGNKNFEGRYMGQTFPPYAAGPCYFLSRPAAEHLARNARALNTGWHNEDMAMGTWLAGADVTFVNEPRIFILGWKEHTRPFIAQHAVDIAPYATTEEWQLALAANFSTVEQQEAPAPA